MSTDVWSTWIHQLGDMQNQLLVTRFGFWARKSAWHIRPRQINDHMVHFVVKNQIQGMVEQLPVKVNEGDCLWLDPGVTHTLWNADVNHPVIVFYLQFRLLCQDRDVRCENHPWVIGHGESLKLILLEMLAEYQGKRAFAEERFRWLLCSLFVLAARQSTPETPQGPKLTSAQCVSIEQVARSLGYRITPAELAIQVRLSPTYFRSLFTKTFGISAKSWLVRGRVSLAAAMLLESNLTISEVADRNGYPNVFEFSRQFKAVMGMGPRAYRDNTGRQPIRARS